MKKYGKEIVFSTKLTLPLFNVQTFVGSYQVCQMLLAKRKSDTTAYYYEKQLMIRSVITGRLVKRKRIRFWSRNSEV